jgi:uncharacterized membrane protein YfcA
MTESLSFVEVCMDPYVVLGSAVVGLVVGLTGAGGGALMTPMLILLFSVKPSAAISSDLVAALVMRPVGAAVHLRRGTANLRLVAWMSAGSVPAAFLGAYVLHLVGRTKAAEDIVEMALGAALLLGAAGMGLLRIVDRRSGSRRHGTVGSVALRPAVTLCIGVVGGFVVGFTSVGAGSLMIVLLMFAYPTLAAKRLVGTDLTQAIPLTAAAALGALVLGHVVLEVTASLVLGSVPAVLVGSLLSSRVPDRYLRPLIAFVIVASGLKYVGMGVESLALVLASLAAAGAVGWAVTARAAQDGLAPATPTAQAGEAGETMGAPQLG